MYELRRMAMTELDGVNLADWVGVGEALELFEQFAESDGVEVAEFFKSKQFAAVDFADFVAERGLCDIDYELGRAIDSLIESSVIYYHDCARILSADILGALELLEQWDNETGGEGMGWDSNKLAYIVLHKLAYEEVYSDLLTAFISNAYKDAQGEHKRREQVAANKLAQFRIDGGAQC